MNVQDNDGGSASAEAQVVVTNTTAGVLVMDESWAGLVTITGDITVPAGVTLTIEPGAVVRFSSGTGVVVYGGFNCLGTIFNPISLESAGLWDGVKITSTGAASNLGYLIIKNAERGLTLVNQSGQISNITFEANRVGLHLVGGTPQILDCLFLTNTQFGIKEDGETNPVVMRCGFNGNIRADYYDEIRTWISVETLNTLAGNSGNYQLRGGVDQ